MLQVFRDHAHKWFVKVLLWVIALSFVLWGVGDIVYKFLANRPVVTVGKHDISQEELSHHLQKETAHINAMTKGKITAQQLKALGLHSNVINRLVDQLVLGDELEKMNLGASDQVLKEQIYNMPVFQTDGKFDDNKFIAMLHQQSMSEAAFIKEASNSLRSQQLLSSISMGAKLPETYVNDLIDALTREKVFTTVEIDSSKIKIDKTPSKDDLQNFYEKFKDKYMIPEYRNITVIILDNPALRKLLGISSDNVRNLYNDRKENLKYPERRNVKRLTYKQQEKASKAFEMVNKGISFAKIAKEIPGGEIEELGLVAKEQLAEFAADKIFELGSGESTEILSTGFGFHIFQVSKIEQPRVATFDEAKEELENVIIQEQKSTKIDEVRSKIDDALAAGKSLTDIANEMSLTVQTIENINAQGKFPDGKAVFANSNALYHAIIEKAFSTEQGLDSGFVDIPGEGAFVLYVNKVNLANHPSFDDVSKRVNQDWLAEKQFEEASDLAVSIASESKSLNALMGFATKHDLVLSTNHALTRREIGKSDRKSADVLPASLAEKAFTLAPETAIAGRNDKGGFTVVMLQKTGDIKATKEEKQDLKNSLDNMIQEDVISATVNAMKELYKIEINQEMLARMAE